MKVPEFDKYLKKAGGHIGWNIVEIQLVHLLYQCKRLCSLSKVGNKPNDASCNQICKSIKQLGWLVWFYGILILFYTYNQFYFKQLSLV